MTDETDVRATTGALGQRLFLAGALVAVAAALWAWTGLDRSLVLGGLVLGGLLLVTTTPAFARRFVGEATPDALGAMRMLTGSVLVFFVWQHPVLDVAPYPGAPRLKMGVMQFVYGLPGFEAMTFSPVAAFLFKAVTLGALLMAAVGWKTRWAVPLGAVLYLALTGVVRSYTHFTHAGLVPMYVLAALAFTRCGDAWSLDRRLRLRRGEAVAPLDRPAAHYAWGRYAVWAAISLPYVLAGLSKLRNSGGRWWHGTNLQAITFNHQFRPEEPVPALLDVLAWFPEEVFTLVGFFTLVTELGMGLVLVSRLARRIFPAAAIGMHLGIFAVMTIPFWGLVALQLTFYNWRPVWNWIRRRLPSRADVRHPEVQEATYRKQENSWWALRRPVAISLLVTLFAVSALRRTESYPLTTWQMFSGYDGSGVVTYVQPWQTDRQGRRSLAPLRTMCVSGRDYRRLLKGGFQDDESRTALRDVLQTCGETWNRSASPDERVARLEVVLYAWDYAEDRRDPNRGAPVDRLGVSFPQGRDWKSPIDPLK